MDGNHPHNVQNCYVEIVRTRYNEETGEIVEDTPQKVYLKDWYTHEGYYVIVYSDFAAKEMCDTITLTVYETVDGVEQAISVPCTDSLQNYAMRMLEAYPDHATLPALIRDMLNYGSACQMQFDYNVNNLANSVLDKELQKTYRQKLGNDLETDPDAEFSIAGHNLIVKSNIVFWIALNGVYPGDEVKVSFTGHKNNTEDYSVTVTAGYYIEISKLVVADYESEITITFGGISRKTSIAAYLSTMGEGDQDNAFYAFGEFAASARAYLEQKKETTP